MADETALKIPVKPPIGGLRKGILQNKVNFDNAMKEVDPKTVPNRLGMVIDDSGSMGLDGMKNAHDAVRGFTNNCSMQDTSIAVYPLNENSKPLSCNYDLVNLYVSSLHATGGTPIYKILDKMIESENMTRAVLFSDGSPTDGSLMTDYEKKDSFYNRPFATAEAAIKKYIAKEIPIDTIYIGESDVSDGYKEMKKIAEMTNGTFIHFKDSTSLSKGLKYLAPKYRALLANADLKAKVERGEAI